MFRKLLALIGIGIAGSAPAVSAEKFSPYKEPSTNFMYNLLFCDDPIKFKPKVSETPTPWQAILFNEPINPEAVLKLAEDASEEGRIRALAYNWLRANGHQVPKQKLLGVIVEVPLETGLDALAAFSDGGIRYINQSGKLVIADGGGLPESKPIVGSLLTAAEAVVSKIGPWDKERLPPPAKGKIRLTFLVSDGLYFGEGPMSVMQREPLAGPVIQHATQLLLLVAKAPAKK